MKIKAILIFTFCCLIIKTYSQKLITGSIVNSETQIKIPYASIVLKNKQDSSIIDYGFSNKNGKFQLTLDSTSKKVFAIFTALGFHKKAISITHNNYENIKCLLDPKIFNLKEVTITSNHPIIIKKDTVIFDAAHFSRENDQVVENLLQNIPGIEVSSNGRISVGTKEIEKVMVEGDDFFEKSYCVLTKSMPSKVIQKVQLIKNYSDNPVLKGINSSNKIALNLKLKEKFKRKWFGDLTFGHDITGKKKHLSKSNLMNFGKKNKYYFLENTNNIGNDAIDNINYLINYHLNNDETIGSNEKAHKLINISNTFNEFSKERINFNNDKLYSINAIFNPHKKVKIKLLTFHNNNKQRLEKQCTETIKTNNTNFTNFENTNIKTQNKIALCKLDVTCNFSKKSNLTSSTKFKQHRTDIISKIEFNEMDHVETLSDKLPLLDHNVKYTIKLNRKKALLLYGRYKHEKYSQDYNFNHVYYQNLYPSYPEANNFNQYNLNKYNLWGFEVHFLNRNINNYLEVKFGNLYRKDNLFSLLTLKQNNAIINNNDKQNKITLFSNQLYWKTKFKYHYKKIEFTSEVNFQYLHKNLILDQNSETQNPLIISPALKFNWDVCKNNNFTCSYSRLFDYTNIINSSNIDLVKNYRTIYRGIGKLDRLYSSLLILNYQHGDWSKKFFANVFLTHIKDHNFLTTNSTINQNFTKSNQIIANNKESLILNVNLDYYLSSLLNNLKFKFNYTSADYKNIINESNLRQFETSTYNIEFQIRSGFKGIFNYHIGSKIVKSHIKSDFNSRNTNLIHFIDLNFNFNKKLCIDLKSENYVLENNDKYYFIDVDLKYKLIQNKLDISLIGRNLSNTNKYRYLSISDIGNNITEHKLIPRYLLLSLSYKI